MSRLWLPFGRRVLVVIVLLASLVLFFPMRLAITLLGLDTEGITARQVSGSVWNARIEDATLAGVNFGTVDAGLKPLDLLIGRARIAVAGHSTSAAGEPMQGALLVSRNTIGVEHVVATLPLAATLAPLPLGGVTLTDFGVRFEDGACAQASGAVQATLTGSLAGVAMNQGLSGTASCDGRYLRLPLASVSARERLDFRLTENGDFVADLIAVEPDPERIAALVALGFATVPGGYKLHITGRI